MMAPVTPVMSVNWMEPCLALTVYLPAATIVAPALMTTAETFACRARLEEFAEFRRRDDGLIRLRCRRR